MLRGLLGGYARGRRQTSAATLSLNFLAGLNDSRITYSGGANGTRVNSSGVIVAATTPRFDYNPVTLAARGLLVEEARTNSLTNSGDWGTDLFLSSAATVTPATGGLCNKRISFTASANALTVKYNAAGNSTLQYANTVRLKSASFTGCILSFRNAAQTIGIQYVVNLTAVTLTDTSYGSPTSKITPSIKLVGGGEYEVTIGGVLNSGGGAETLGFYVFNPGATAGTLDVGAGQSEVGAFATSYIPTTTAAVTRTADSAVMTGTNFSSWYNQSEGTFVAGFDTVEADSTAGNVFEVGDGTFNERMNAFISSTPTVNFVVTDGGVQVANFSTGAYTVGAVAKVATAYALNNFAGSLNGGTPGTDTSGTIPTVNALYIGRQGAGGANLNGHIQTITYFPRRSANEQLQAMTA